MAEARPGRTEPALSARQPRAIHTALTVLEAVAELGVGVTAKELSARLALPRATTYRLLNLLVQDEYLVRTPDLSGFALGAKVAQLAAAAVPRRLPTLARDIVAEVRVEMRGGIHVAAFDDRRLHVLDEDPDFPFSDTVRLAREPERYALGALMLLAAGDDGSVAAAAGVELAHLGGVRRVDATIVGYGCLAVPLHRPDGAIAGAIAFAGPRHRIVDADDVLARLAPVAERIAPYIA